MWWWGVSIPWSVGHQQHPCVLSVWLLLFLPLGTPTAFYATHTHFSDLSPLLLLLLLL